MMFWIGFCAGVSVSLLIIIVGISAIGWGVGKERSKAAENQKALMEYWRESMENQREQITTLDNIGEYIRRKS